MEAARETRMSSDSESDTPEVLEFRESMSAKEVRFWLHANGIPMKFSAVFEGKTFTIGCYKLEL